LLDQHDERAAQNNSCNGICTVPSAARELNISSASTAEPTFNVRQISYLGRIRSVLTVALMQTPHRFRTKRQLWAYSIGLETGPTQTTAM
jgi:hypothetical protein